MWRGGGGVRTNFFLDRRILSLMRSNPGNVLWIASWDLCSLAGLDFVECDDETRGETHLGNGVEAPDNDGDTEASHGRRQHGENPVAHGRSLATGYVERWFD